MMKKLIFLSIFCLLILANARFELLFAKQLHLGNSQPSLQNFIVFEPLISKPHKVNFEFKKFDKVVKSSFFYKKISVTSSPTTALYAQNSNNKYNKDIIPKNKKMSDQFFAENIKKPGVKQTESGLQYRIIEEGKGKQPSSAQSLVSVHYAGRLIDGREFDSSIKRGRPIDFRLNQVIVGWTEGLQLMKEGAKYELFIPAHLAYGNNAPPGSIIEPGATLIFEVQLLEVKN